MSIRVHVEGRICSPENAHISVFDRGFLYGDSVYETIGTAYGRLFAVNTPGRALVEVNLATAEVRHMALAAEPDSIAVGPQSGAVYVLDRVTNAIVKLDPGDGSELGRAFLGDGPASAPLPLHADTLWLRPRMVVSTVGERIYVIDPQTGTLAVTSLYQ